ncbi:hypothetical protein GO485_06910 [Pseudoduganella flava]|uniref:Uncharacterized protein n=1 Tax=Pseudoduganella flava TaxID=871742 RepID=A0ABX6G0W1_9BURK|nr:hypothetical protein GO485_06910 [Pseudoduganella flava]
MVRIVVVIAVLVAVVWLVMMLWNWLMPALFDGARTIDYWHALGLLVLCKILFGGGHGRWREHRRWHHMSAAEREEFGRRFRGRCRDGYPGSDSATSMPAGDNGGDKT